tara:strand:- start:1330 stop:2100 length:771 start_codon:yes stop_codon:yes gene_type:complete
LTIPPQKLRKLIDSNSLALGSWITIGDNKVTEILCQAGFDWLAIDIEHSTINIEKVGDLIQIISLNGVTPLVRLTDHNWSSVKRVMDAGAGGIIIPNITTSEQVVSAINSTRYPPQGTRGVGLARAQNYGESFHEYLKWQKQGPIVIAQIENIDAIANLDIIFGTKGLDGFMIGPYDLSCSMGIPGDFLNKNFIKAVDEILFKGKKYGLSIGTHVVEPDLNLLQQKISQGFNFIAYSVDIRMLSVTARQARNVLKK